jgi:hypothetical protein
MGIREQINKHPAFTTGIAIGVIIVMVVFIFRVAGGNGTPAFPRKAFFTEDDGASWFVDDANKVPPFDHKGKQAVRAYVYKCGDKTFVNHMERFTPGAKKKLEQTPGDDLLAKSDPSISGIPVNSKEVKSPGQRVWVNIADPRASEVLRIKCDKPNEAELVMP